MLSVIDVFPTEIATRGHTFSARLIYIYQRIIHIVDDRVFDPTIIVASIIPTYKCYHRHLVHTIYLEEIM